MDGKSEHQVLIGGGCIRRQSTEELSRKNGIIDSRGDDCSGFGFDDGCNVAIIAEGIKKQAAPIARAWDACDSIVVRIGLRASIGLGASTDTIVPKARKNHWESRHAEDLYGTTDTIADAREPTCGRQTCSSFLIEVRALAFHLDDQRFIDGALKSQTTYMLKVADSDRIKQHVNDIGIIPNALGCQQIALEVAYRQVVLVAIVGRGIGSNFQAVDAVVE